ncbi:MAG: SDR family oxidoreductase, partial [Clostridia bacterium]
VSCREQVEIMREQVEKLFKRIDVLVLCSGVSLVRLITDTTDEEYDRVMNINARGQFNCMRAFLPTMIQKKEGSIVCVSSVWGEHGASCEAVYAMSKSAVIGLSKSASLEVAPSGIRVNCICPGVIDTKMNDCFSNEEKEEITKKIPLGRFGKVEEVAELIFDISENEYITGQVVSINGGFAI